MPSQLPSRVVVRDSHLRASTDKVAAGLTTAQKRALTLEANRKAQREADEAIIKDSLNHGMTIMIPYCGLLTLILYV